MNATASCDLILWAAPLLYLNQDEELYFASVADLLIAMRVGFICKWRRTRLGQICFDFETTWRTFSMTSGGIIKLEMPGIDPGSRWTGASPVIELLLFWGIHT